MTLAQFARKVGFIQIRGGFQMSNFFYTEKEIQDYKNEIEKLLSQKEELIKVEKI